MPELVNLKFQSQKRKASRSETVQSKVVKSDEISKIEDIPAPGDKNHESENLLVEFNRNVSNLNDFKRFLKGFISKEVEKVEKRTITALKVKDRNYAELRHDKETLELEMRVLGDKRKKEKDYLKLEFQKQMEEGLELKKKLCRAEETINKALVTIKNQNTEISQLQLEVNCESSKISALERNLDSMEVEIKQVNQTLVEKDQAVVEKVQCIMNLENDLNNRNVETSRLKQVSSGQLEQIENLESLNKQISKDLIAKESRNEMVLKDLSAKETEMGILGSENHESNVLIKTIRSDLEKRESDLEEKQQEINDLESIHKSLERKTILLKQNHAEMTKRLEKRITEGETQCASLHEEINENDIDTRKHEAEIEHLKQINVDLTRALNEKKKSLEEKEIKLKSTLFDWKELRQR